MEPLSVAVHAVATLAQVKTNQSVAVFGCGPVGLLCMAVAKALGASRVVAVDINPDRLAFAQNYAATDGFMPPKKNAEESTITYSRRATDEMKAALGIEERGPTGIDIVLDASGAETSIQMALYLAKIGGMFVQVGMGKAEVTVPITLLLVKELVVKGSFRYGVSLLLPSLFCSR